MVGSHHLLHALHQADDVLLEIEREKRPHRIAAQRIKLRQELIDLFLSHLLARIQVGRPLRGISGQRALTQKGMRFQQLEGKHPLGSLDLRQL